MDIRLKRIRFYCGWQLVLFYHYSDTWQLLVNTATTVFTYLAVFLIQNTQNRDAKAVHLKLDELISSVMVGARNRLVNLEYFSDSGAR